MKKTVLTAVILCSTIAFAGCGNNNNSGSSEEKAASSVVESKAKEASSAVESKVSEVSSDISNVEETHSSDLPTIETVEDSTNLTADNSYEEIYDEYKGKVAEKAKELTADAKAELADHKDDAVGLDELVHSKTDQLDGLVSKGTGLMADKMMNHGGDKTDYKEWVDKLNDFELEEVKKIHAAYR